MLAPGLYISMDAEGRAIFLDAISGHKHVAVARLMGIQGRIQSQGTGLTQGGWQTAVLARSELGT